MAPKLDPRAHSISLLADGELVEESDLGSIQRVTADQLPILSGLSIKRLVLNPGAMRTPHWHANANELTYCISGTSLVSVLDSGSQFTPYMGHFGFQRGHLGSDGTIVKSGKHFVCFDSIEQCPLSPGKRRQRPVGSDGNIDPHRFDFTDAVGHLPLALPQPSSQKDTGAEAGHG